jgi:hypothetical protein
MFDTGLLLLLHANRQDTEPHDRSKGTKLREILAIVRVWRLHTSSIKMIFSLLGARHFLSQGALALSSTMNKHLRTSFEKRGYE